MESLELLEDVVCLDQMDLLAQKVRVETGV